MEQPADKVQIGLTKDADADLERMMALDWFSGEYDAYKLAVAYAIGRGLEVNDAPQGGYGTKFNAAGGIDRDGTLRDLIAALLPEHAHRPYATAEKLAELGIRDLARRLDAHERLSDILAELQDAGADSPEYGSAAE